MHLEALQDLALRISGERDGEAVLRQIVAGLVQQPGIALARVWIVKPGDICRSCRMRSLCPDQTSCLHLAASAGKSLSGESWSRTDGDFRRMPLAHLKVGSIASNRTGLLIADPQSEKWARPEWVKNEGIISFVGQPLIFRDDTLGVLRCFDESRSTNRSSVGCECSQTRRHRRLRTPARLMNSHAFSNS